MSLLLAALKNADLQLEATLPQRTQSPKKQLLSDRVSDDHNCPMPQPWQTHECTAATHQVLGTSAGSATATRAVDRRVLILVDLPGMRAARTAGDVS